jgi:glycerol-3-phosphate dehydrogenase
MAFSTAAEVTPEVDVLVVGAGITGINQLHRTLGAGFSALRSSTSGSGASTSPARPRSSGT